MSGDKNMSIAIIKNVNRITPVIFPFTLIEGSTIKDTKHVILNDVSVSTYGSGSKSSTGFSVGADSNQDVNIGGSITITLKQRAIGKIAKLQAGFSGSARYGDMIFRVYNGNTLVYNNQPYPGTSPSASPNLSFTINSNTITVSASYTGYSSNWAPSVSANVSKLEIDEA